MSILWGVEIFPTSFALSCFFHSPMLLGLSFSSPAFSISGDQLPLLETKPVHSFRTSKTHVQTIFTLRASYLWPSVL